ncbi:hypothetical protein AOXY_G18870 [Acipenser oxyrinchus oxyrinchus]|uniref:Peptidase M60 domain-containing protein n=1 Tax=Acipenser oxyrinchus oxyrinchus TaxID=40147 RepID=A0AAD8D0I5_ACIOX|nr:hypothetical protein AOXY_G23655 [Acipenser oxyrinchus oxyrinchus]KAK1161369.1 hypothetical protein AOXY_G18870 [Acipenser oxyrinchus oxyrinchus]
MRNGAQLDQWEVWVCLETYLQLQEGFGWEPFIQLFSDYQQIPAARLDKVGRMNLWAEKCSQQVKRNLLPFFKAWGGLSERTSPENCQLCQRGRRTQ